MITRQGPAYYIVNSGAVSLTADQVVSHPDNAVVQEFSTEEEMLAAHQAQYPEQYEGEL